MDYDERYHASLPRDAKHMDGRHFTITARQGEVVTIADDEGRTADYRPLPGSRTLDMAVVRIKPAYIEAGRFCEGNVVTLTDGRRDAVFVPVNDPYPPEK